MLALRTGCIAYAVPICGGVSYSTMAPVDMQHATKHRNKKNDPLWQETGLIPGKQAPTEALLKLALQRIFPNEEIKYHVRKSLNIKREQSSYLEIDASIPSLNLHIEYQDPYHYTTSVYYANRPLDEIQSDDQFKRQYFAERGESLLQLPCWWDGTDESLVATIKLMRPDLLPHLSPSCSPVPETEPENFIYRCSVPDIGPLKRPVTFTKKYYERSNDWVASEKYDGVRCCWNPKRQQLYSRQGNELRFPEEFAQHMPDEFLDGEIWFGRDFFFEAMKVSSQRTSPVNWPNFRIVAFDIPSETNATYSERYGKLYSLIPDGHPFLFVPAEIQITNDEQRLNIQKMIAKVGGEGIILTEKNSKYEPGQTSNVLKVKPALDKEARVIFIENAQAVLELTDQTRFKASIPNDIQPPPRVGDVITFTYKRCLSGTTLPYKPQILRIRGDMTWEEVVAVENDGKSQVKRGKDYTTRWDAKLGDLKAYFKKYAQENDFDPLVASNWYSVSRRDIIAIPGSYALLKRFNGSVVDALGACFPEIGIDQTQFSKIPQRFWQRSGKLRKWFDNFAKDQNFDPLIPENWYSLKRAVIMKTNKGKNLLKTFRGLPNAIFTAYPEIGIDKSQFPYLRVTWPRGHWEKAHNLRTWFDEFANEKGFDSLSADSWYLVRGADLKEKLGGEALLKRHNHSYIDALKKAYPELKFSTRRQATLQKKQEENEKQKEAKGKHDGQEKAKRANYLTNTQSVRKKPVPRSKGASKDLRYIREQFDQFAKEQGFDPLNAENWYKITHSDIKASKHGRSIIRIYKYSHIDALLVGYPDIGLDKSKFATVKKGHWKDIQNVRNWFNGFAKVRGFDPLVAENWYSVTHTDIKPNKGSGILRHYNWSYPDALVATYPNIGIDKLKFTTKTKLPAIS